MKIGKLLWILCCAFLSIPSFAGNSPACSPAGTWYGGSDVKYLLTITPITGEIFAARAEVVLDIAAVGLPAWTSWSGQFRRVTGGRYVGQYISMYTSSSEVPPPENSYELDAVRGWMEFTDCDNIRIAYDFYGLYFDLNKVPYIDPPDVSVDVSGLVETYHRVPTVCKVCDTSSAPTAAGRKKH